MQKQNINDYFKMLGEIFEWICYESDDEVELSAVCVNKDGEYQFKPDCFINGKSALCIGTIMSACKAYDKANGTNYYDKFMFAKENGVEHNE